MLAEWRLPALVFSALWAIWGHIEKAPGGMSTEGLVVEYLKRAVPRRRLGRGSSTTKQAHDDVT